MVQGPKHCEDVLVMIKITIKYSLNPNTVIIMYVFVKRNSPAYTK